MPRVPDFYEANLWSRDCTDCPLFDPCGGSHTAPCGCVKSGAAYHKCDTCNVICRERLVRRADDSVEDSFNRHLANSAPLSRVSLTQPVLDFPRVILARTPLLPANVQIQRQWVGAMFRDLFTEGGNLRRHSAGADQLRRHLRVGKKTKLLAVLNADDVSLENFWKNAKRRDLLQQLIQSSIMATTGPTYSILLEDGAHPASHNLVMLQRHHQVVFEAQRVGLTVIPNLYWRSREDLVRWARWLDRESNVTAVSRDFSRTKQRAPFLHEMHGLVSILKTVDRRLHVILIGVGEGKAQTVSELMAEVGCSWSVISGRPLLAAKNGVLIPEAESRNSGELKSDLPFRQLARENVKRFEGAMNEPARPRAEEALQQDFLADLYG